MFDPYAVPYIYLYILLTQQPMNALTYVLSHITTSNLWYMYFPRRGSIVPEEALLSPRQPLFSARVRSVSPADTASQGRKLLIVVNY